MRIETLVKETLDLDRRPDGLCDGSKSPWTPQPFRRSVRTGPRSITGVAAAQHLYLALTATKLEGPFSDSFPAEDRRGLFFRPTPLATDVKPVSEASGMPVSEMRAS